MKDLKIESLIPKFATERIEPENASKRVVRCRACTSWCSYDQDRHRLRALCAAALSERVPFFSGRGGSSRRGGRGEKKSFFEESWTLTFVCLASRHQSRIPSSTEKQVLGLGIMAQSTPRVPIPPGMCWAFQCNRPFSHSCKQWHQLEARVDKIQWFVWNCPTEPLPHFFVFAHWSVMRERSIQFYSHFYTIFTLYIVR